MKTLTLNKSKLIRVIKEYNSNKSISNSSISFLSSSTAAAPRLQYYNYYVDGNSTKIK